MSEDDIWYLVPSREDPGDTTTHDDDVGLLVDLSCDTACLGRTVRPGPFSLPKRIVGRRGRVRDKV